MLLIDVGSTVIKLKNTARSGEVVRFARDYQRSIEAQVKGIVLDAGGGRCRICSSANGGLRVGILTLGLRFSGNIAEKLALLAGANVIFIKTFRDALDGAQWPEVDTLIIAGGVNDRASVHVEQFLETFEFEAIRADFLIYCGASQYATKLERYSDRLLVCANPLDARLRPVNDELIGLIQQLYLKDLTSKREITALDAVSEVTILPTPGIVSHAFDRIIHGEGNLDIIPSCVLLDIGGATTDLHYTTDLVIDENGRDVALGKSIRRFVFTEVGVFKSKESLKARLAKMPRLFDFFRSMYGEAASQKYTEFKEGELDESLCFYACVFVTLNDITQGEAAKVPHLNLQNLCTLIISGGAGSVMQEAPLRRVLKLFKGHINTEAKFYFDKDYNIWTLGLEGGAHDKRTT